MRGVFENPPGMGPPSTVVLDADAGASYSVVDEQIVAVRPPRVPGRRPVGVQMVLEFAMAMMASVGGFFRFFAGIAMALSFLAALVFVGLYFLMKVDNLLWWATLTGGTAFVMFCFCYITGLVEGAAASWVYRARIVQ